MAPEPALTRDQSPHRALQIVGVALVVVVSLLTWSVWRAQAQHAAIERTAACRSRAAGAVEAVQTFRNIEDAEARAGLTDALVALADTYRGPGSPFERAVEAAAVHAGRVRAYDGRLVELARLRAASSDECDRDAGWRVPEQLTITEP